MNTSTSTITGTLGERKDCEFDPRGNAHIMSLLSNMYRNSKAAVLREYAANGVDSHRAAGVTRPVEVTLPSPLAPTLTIADTGLGLSTEDVENVYAKYGASTKRDSNDDIGGFGIGAKSAFTVASQFTVNAVKDGVQTIAVFSMDNKGAGYNIVSVSKTKRGNGVTIQIPVANEDITAWEEESRNVFRTWPEGAVTVNGESPVSIFSDARQVTDHLWWAGSRLEFPFMVVMGGVGYQGSHDILRKLDEHWRLLEGRRAIIEVPIGSMDISPDREGLRDTSRTIEAIRTAIDGAQESLEAQLQDEMDDAADDVDKVIAWSKACADFPFLTISNPTTYDSIHSRDARRVSGGRNSRTTRNDIQLRSTGLRSLLDTTVIKGEWTSKASRMLPRWRRHNGWIDVVITSSDMIDWVPVSKFSKVITVDEMLEEAKSLAPLSATSPRAEVRYIVHGSDWDCSDNMTGPEIKAMLAEDERPIYLATKNRGWRADNERERLAKFEDEEFYTVALSGSQTLNALCKRIGVTPTPISTRLQELVESKIGSVSEDDLIAHANSQASRWNSTMRQIQERATGKLKTLADEFFEKNAPLDEDVVYAIQQKTGVVTPHIIDQKCPLLANIGSWRAGDMLDSILEWMD